MLVLTELMFFYEYNVCSRLGFIRYITIPIYTNERNYFYSVYEECMSRRTPLYLQTSLNFVYCQNLFGYIDCRRWDLLLVKLNSPTLQFGLQS
jgi:hypothetical protein